MRKDGTPISSEGIKFIEECSKTLVQQIISLPPDKRVPALIKNIRDQVRINLRDYLEDASRYHRNVHSEICLAINKALGKRGSNREITDNQIKALNDALLLLLQPGLTIDDWWDAKNNLVDVGFDIRFRASKEVIDKLKSIRQNRE